MNAASPRTADFDIAPHFVERWSPRAFETGTIDDATLFSLFEAARWAPSAANAQPWRFLYARNGGKGWNTLLGLLNDDNRRWAARAPVLILLLSKKYVTRDNGEQVVLRSHSFDAGAAWASLAFQAYHLGLRTRAMGGFDRQAAHAQLGIPDSYNAEIVIAAGRQADQETLHPDLRDRENPNGRRPARELALEGAFAFSD